MADFSWDDLHFFLAVARDGQLSRAARRLGTSHVTVSRRIDRLERALKLRLFERNPRGYEPTAAGRRLIETAERMEEAALRIPVDQSSTWGQSRPLRLAVPEGFGTFFSTRLLPEFTRRFPLISLELMTMTQILSLSRREAELSVTLDPLTSGPYRSEKMVNYTLHIFASRDYLRQNTMIRSRDDLPGHRFIGYIEEMIVAPGLDYLGEIHPAIRPVIKSSSIFNQLAATRSGLGLCVLPHYIASRHPDLQIVLPDQVRLQRSYWMTCHRDIRHMRRESAVIGFLTDSLREREAILNRPGPPAEPAPAAPPGAEP